MSSRKPSPFFTPGPTTYPGSLAMLSLKRDLQMPVVLQTPNPTDPTASVIHTRFGSFPHTTLLNIPWGSQVIASQQSKRDAARGKKRKRGTADAAPDDADDNDSPVFETASSGFVHVLPPTPELWTAGLQHRTQVVYTPDYSFVLQRLRVRPGDVVIEAGAGSGSFTHAAARAVFSGYPGEGAEKRRLGQVFSFEYHEPRCESVRAEIAEHGLEGVVEVNYRDVYEEGFTLGPEAPRADAVFLDLPAPWLALRHLSRTEPSPLNPATTTRICTFSPCIEQVQRTVTTLRELGWTSIVMYELQHRRLDVRRELVSVAYDGLRGVNSNAASVDEALTRLRHLEEKTMEFHGKGKDTDTPAKKEKKGKDAVGRDKQEAIRRRERELQVWKEGRLVHRTEQDIKTHTSYLTFAVLPRAWSKEDEERCRKKWAVKTDTEDSNGDVTMKDDDAEV
ncbi:tRNA methyltransferase complex GCD14 subunit [Trichodelitschia bisporula]|uniref:tRNA (adenine(58)-N(1))-methyltransferase catalytic subunit TRM61 n=1 Tax=Trichodelitschia bisporula TaxID=703511 RepID=A0A6G1I402_9PEZI|nr:tRNA methyltransferase complex GCD14 subunit [Trichodelitschia bisporula]